jgi:hypothetical protein
MKQILFSNAIALVIMVGFSRQGDHVPFSNPNVIFILADDLGYGDLRCDHVDSMMPTPSIDQPASQRMMFTDVHSPSVVCSPARYGILTGLPELQDSIKVKRINNHLSISVIL